MTQLSIDDLFVTTDKAAQRADVALAARIADDLGAPHVVRNTRSLAHHSGETGRRAALVVSGALVHLSVAGKSLGFHPNMAAHRIKAPSDSFITAAQIKPGDHVLDLTCGMGADAIIAAHHVGKLGRVVALEASPILTTIVARGLAQYDAPEPLKTAMRRVDLRNAKAGEALMDMEENSFDVVVLDPMFPHARRGADGIELVRALALHDLPDDRLIAAAKRVARRCVVMSDSATGARLAALGFTRITQNRTKCWGRLRADTP